MATKSYIDSIVSITDQVLDVDAGTYNGDPIYQDISGLVTDSTFNTLDGNFDNLVALTGYAEGSTTLGTFTGVTISDSVTLQVALQELETAIEAAPSNAALTEAISDITEMQTLLGTSDEDTDLGSFVGGIISDSATVKSALTELEAEIETESAALNTLEASSGRWFFADLDATGSTDAALVSLPANAHVMEVRVNVTTAFAGGTSPSISVGWTADDDAVVPAGDFNVGAIERSELSLQHKMVALQDVRCYIQGAPTSGIAEVALFVVG